MSDIDLGNIAKQAAQDKPKITVTDENTDPVVCSCGNDIYISGIKLRRVSPLLVPTPDGNPTYVPFQMYVCSECKTPLDTLISTEETEPN